MNLIEFIRSVSSETAEVTARVDGRPAIMLRNSRGELLLAVKPGRGFGLRVRNKTQRVRAFPATAGNGDTELNVYAKCPITDPSLMPSTGGMWECRPGRDVDIDAFELPGSLNQLFIAEDSGLGYGDFAANTIRVWERPPADPNAVIVKPEPQSNTSGSPLEALMARGGSGTRSAGGPVIGAAAVQAGERQITNLDYLEATDLVRVRLITREQAANLLFDGEGRESVSWLAAYAQYGPPANIQV